jgi:HD associated region
VTEFRVPPPHSYPQKRDTLPKALTRLHLRYWAKGNPAIESLLLARYQMFGAVYWHHTFRCIQSMFVHVIASLLKNKKGRKCNFSPTTLTVLRKLFYTRVICGNNLAECKKIPRISSIPQKFFEDFPPSPINKIRILEFFWRLACQPEDQPERLLLKRLAKRELYKQAFEIKLGDFEGQIDYSAIKGDLEPKNRVALAETRRGLSK